jgi:hypothetical protein
MDILEDESFDEDVVVTIVITTFFCATLVTAIII